MSKTVSNILSQIVKIGNDLSELHKDFLIEKHSHLNHKRIVEYLFNKPLEKVLGYDDLLALNYESTVKLVRIELSDDTDSFLILMKKYLLKFSKKYAYYEKCINVYKNRYDRSLHNLLKINCCLPVESKLSSDEKNIIQILDEVYDMMEEKFNYVYKWNFMVEGENNMLGKLPTINFSRSFVYDFYGIIIWHNQLVQFAILFDDDSHFDSARNKFQKIHHDDILKQYILFQMNVHLLRLNKKHNLRREIMSFIQKISTSTNYVIHYGIRPIVRFFQFNGLIDKLVSFRKDYEYNHQIYLKTPSKKHPKYNSDDDEYFELQSIRNNFSELPPEPNVIVPNNVIKKILKEKNDFHPPKKETFNEKKADQIIVKLKQDNNVESEAEPGESNDEMREGEMAEVLEMVFG